MKSVQPILPFLLAWFAAPAPAQHAAPEKPPEPPRYTFLWKVEHAGLPANYLFGTIHVPDDRVNTLHPDVKSVLNAADAFYAELELGDTTELQSKLIEAATLPEGETLQTLLPEDLYAEVERAFADQKLLLRAVQGFEPFMVQLMLLQQEMMADMLAGKEPLDIRLYKVAQSKGKQVGGVELVDEQIKALCDTLTVEEQITSLRTGLQQHFEAKERGESPLQRILVAWLSGSERWILAVGMEDWDMHDPIQRKSYEALLPQRNRNMAVRSAKLMRESPDKKFVFAFGTFHFIGEDSVVELLRMDGFTVTRLLAPPPELEERWIADDPGLAKEEETVEVGGK
jgi:uncharacterized protein YbaP (TraB family)